MLETDSIPSGETIGYGGGVPTGPSKPRAVLLTLVPNSAIQLIDFDLDVSAVSHTRRRFFEEATEGGDPSLHVASDGDELFYHPETGEPCDPARTYAVGGTDALKPFLGRWLPIPYMRVTRRGEDSLVLDEGPSNWTRVHITRGEEAEGLARYRIVLAVDTAIEQSPAGTSQADVAPTVEDLEAGAAFRFSDDVADVAWFVSEAWVDDWLQDAFDAATAGGEQSGTERGRLEHLACYLTLLAVLKEAAELPALRFMEPNAVGAYAETVPVDLALDLGTVRTSALLEERDTARSSAGPAGRDVAPVVLPLPLRDLSKPWLVTAGTYSSRLVFARATFGNEAISRWSGRTQAFHWPSPVRIGAEAERLAVLPAAGDAMTGVSSPMHYVWDERPSRHLWRYVTEGAPEGARRNPVVSGSILAHLSESGDFLESRGGSAATTKPRFSRSSLVTLLVGEVLLQAVAAINAPEARTERPRPTAARRLDRILVTPPSGMGEAERAVLRRRVEAAVRLVWQSMGWAVQAHPLAPSPPSITLVADTATSIGIAWLENEIAYKLRGRADSLLALLGRARAGYAGSRQLRLATLDIGGATSSLSVATWELTPGGALVASRQLVEGFETGCDDVVKACAERYVLAALVNRLGECRHPEPGRLVEALLGPDDRGRPAWVGDLGRRLAAELLAPAARALLQLYAHSESDAGDAPAEPTIGALLSSVGASARSVADRLDVVAADEGADGFSPLDVTVPFLMRDLGSLAREVLRPMLDGVVRVLGALDCDVVLLAGGGARLPAVMQTILAGMPLRPDRIIAMHPPRLAEWYPSSDAALLPVAGALLQARGSFGAGGPAIVVQPAVSATTHGFVGRLGADGRIAAEDVLFDSTGDGAARSGTAQAMRGVGLGLPALIGRRTPSLASWPAQAAWVLERDPGNTGRPPKLPIRATLELSAAEGGKPGTLKLVSALDGDGGRLDPSEILLRMKTRRFAEGYWLDTGHLVAARTRTSP